MNRVEIIGIISKGETEFVKPNTPDAVYVHYFAVSQGIDPSTGIEQTFPCQFRTTDAKWRRPASGKKVIVTGELQIGRYKSRPTFDVVVSKVQEIAPNYLKFVEVGAGLQYSIHNAIEDRHEHTTVYFIGDREKSLKAAEKWLDNAKRQQRVSSHVGMAPDSIILIDVEGSE